MKAKAFFASLGAAAVALVLLAPASNASPTTPSSTDRAAGNITSTVAPLPISALTGQQPAPTIAVATAENTAVSSNSVVPMSHAPTCVHLKQWASGKWDYARATNTCSYTVRIKMNWAWAVDGRCTTLKSGWYYTEGRLRPGHYVQALDNC